LQVDQVVRCRHRAVLLRAGVEGGQSGAMVMRWRDVRELWVGQGWHHVVRDEHLMAPDGTVGAPAAPHLMAPDGTVAHLKHRT
jgi:hypothetical protein